MLTLPPAPARPRGRYAPSPTGLLHVGSARTALAAWLSVQAQDGLFAMRVEDLDAPRTVPGMADAILDDLRWMGLDWDHGPDIGGPDVPYRQSARSEHYEAALALLHERGRLFPCRVSRKDLQELASAPHGTGGLPPYPPELRPQQLPPGWFDAFRGTDTPDAALRFEVAPGPVTFEDAVCGAVTEHVDAAVGDFVLKRRDGVYAYQLAVVVDDLLMGVSEVVRGQDLLDSTGRQIQLIEALGGVRPTYAHVPLVVNEEGEKLSKRDESLTIRSLRTAGITPHAFVGYLGYSLGLLPEATPCTPADLVPLFDWRRIPRTPWRLSNDVSSALTVA